MPFGLVFYEVLNDDISSVTTMTCLVSGHLERNKNAAGVGKKHTHVQQRYARMHEHTCKDVLEYTHTHTHPILFLSHGVER